MKRTIVFSLFAAALLSLSFGTGVIQDAYAAIMSTYGDVIDNAILTNSTIGATNTITSTRAQLVQNDAQAYTVPVYSLRAADGNVLGISDGSDSGDHYLTYSAGVWALMGNSPSSDTQTDVSSFQFSLPPEYVAAETITIRANALYTADGDTKTVDLNVYKINPTAGTKGSDICATAAITLTGTAAARDFTVTATALAPGDLLCVVLTTVFQDADGAVGEAKVNSVQVLLDVKG